MLAVGDPIPEFEATDTAGRGVRSSDLRGRSFVLFFYPKAGSWGCSREARAFAARLPEFDALGVPVFGVSVDPEEAQRSFVADCHLPYPLLLDATRTLARGFGVLGAFGLARRVTFVIGPDGRVRHVTDRLRPGGHVEEALGASAPSSPSSTGGSGP